MSGSWMSIIEYARHNNVSDMTVRRRIKTGRLLAELREGKYFIPIQELNQTYQHEPEIEKAKAAPVYQSPRREEKKERVEPIASPARYIHAVTEHSHLEMQMDRLSENIEGVLERLNQHESILKANFESEKNRFQDRLELLQTELQAKDQEIQTLRKEIEDLEVLVRILEKKIAR